MGTQKALIANNYGRGVYGLYNASRYQHVWSMGTGYNLCDNGTGAGNLYGLAWTHTNVGGQSKSGLSHQLLVMYNGITCTAIGTGIWTAGSITVGGTVDGRDVAADGAKLNGIACGATACTGTTTASNSQTFTNKSGCISQWNNNSGYTTCTGDITAVVAGTDLTGGATSGSATLNVTSSTNSTVNTIVKRDGSGDINARLLRSEYDSTNSSIGFIMTQIDTASNNYIRPSTMAQVRSSLNVANGATLVLVQQQQVTHRRLLTRVVA